MKVISMLALGALVGSAVAKPTPEEREKYEAIRAEIPLGGDFEPKPEEGVFVAAGHGLNVVASRDDGKTWERVFYAGPGGDHGPWAVWNSVAYTEGVFAVAAGWGYAGTILASEDGKNWRHLSDGKTQVSRKEGKPYDMPTTMQLLGVEGHFIMPWRATPDFGKTWHQTSPYGLKDEDGERIKVNTGHPSLGFAGGRVIVVGDEGPALYSDDFGETWAKLDAEIGELEARGTKTILGKDGIFILVKGSGEFVFRSEDKGETWKRHELGVKRPAGRSYAGSIVGDEFWITGEVSMASKDGIEWRKLPEGTPSGRVAESESGVLVNVSRKRNSILRSDDGGESWDEVYTFEPEGSGGAQGLGGIAWGKVKRLDP